MAEQYRELAGEGVSVQRSATTGKVRDTSAVVTSLRDVPVRQETTGGIDRMIEI